MQNRKSVSDKNYLEILRDSLLKKIAVLDRISQQNKIQADLAKEQEFDYDRFGKTLDEKEKLIEELNKLDEGFQAVYDRIKEEIVPNALQYKNEINELKQLISQITEKSTAIKVEENHNRDAVMGRTDSLKKEITMARATNQAAANYYKTMSQLNVVDSQFLDAKK